MPDVGLAPETVDELLAPYERRDATTSLKESAERRHRIAFGWELNRIQGASRPAVSERLAELFCTGRITREEYVALSADLAARGLLRVTHQHPHAD